MISVDLSGAESFFDSTGPDYAAAAAAHRLLTEHAEAEDEAVGWLSLPKRVVGDELKSILLAAERIRSGSQVLLVIGAGGSSLGARAAIELLKSPDYNLLEKDTPDVFFVGNNLSQATLNRVIQLLGDRDFSINVISKSGGTIEPAVAFRIFRDLAVKKYGDKAKKHIFATTDAENGLLHDMAVKEGWERFVVPADVGGRYSVLSAVGLLPMAVCGIDVSRLLSAAAEAFRELDERSPANPAWQYAAARQHFYRQGKSIELLASYEPAFHGMAEWWKQLFGESEGKNGVGLFPAALEYTADLHSMGQLVQDGPRILMETVVNFEASGEPLKLPFLMGDSDRLNYLAGKAVSRISAVTASAVKAAHIAGGVPNIGITVPDISEESLASLFCFFELSCAISSYMLGVHPFDQPGVEAYKTRMKEMLASIK